MTCQLCSTHVQQSNTSVWQHRETGRRWKLWVIRGWIKSRVGTEVKKKKCVKYRGVPQLGEEFRAGLCHLLGLTRYFFVQQFESSTPTPKFCLLPPPLIGFNKRFNNTSLLNQIKLFLNLIPGQVFVMPASCRSLLSAQQAPDLVTAPGHIPSVLPRPAVSPS